MNSNIVSHTTSAPNLSPSSREQALDKCRNIATAPDVLAKLDEALHGCGLAGETRRAKLLYLATVTRLFGKPVNMVVKGPPAGGKSHLLHAALAFTPASAFHRVSGMSPKAIIYSQADLRHRFLLIEEFAGLQSEAGNP